MSDDAMPSRAEWLAEYRSRPEPREVALYRVALANPMTSPVSRVSGLSALSIVRYDDPRHPVPTDGFYLFALDAHGHKLTDTWHEDLEDAFAQAEFEFGIHRDEWHAVADAPS